MTDLTTVFVPGLLSDDRVWKGPAERLGGINPHFADVTRQGSIEEMARDVLSGVEGDLLVAGHSMGGRVAMEMARQAPERVKGLILANTGHVPTRDGEEAERLNRVELGHRDMGALADEWLPPMVDEARHDDTGFMAELRDMVLDIGPEVHERQIRALLKRPDAGAYLSEITCPVLLLTGDKDSWSPAAQHEEIAEMLPDAELRLVGSAGHFAPIERPNETAREIEAWLERHLFVAGRG